MRWTPQTPPYMDPYVGGEGERLAHWLLTDDGTIIAKATPYQDGWVVQVTVRKGQTYPATFFHLHQKFVRDLDSTLPDFLAREAERMLSKKAS